MSHLFYFDATSGGLCGAIFKSPFTKTAQCIWNEQILTERPSANSLSQLFKSGLDKTCLSLNDITYLGVAHGPGSFTGIKISLAWAYGFCAGAPHLVSSLGFSSLQLVGQWLFQHSTKDELLLFLPNTKTHSFLAHFKRDKDLFGKLSLIEDGSMGVGLDANKTETFSVGIEKTGAVTLSLKEFYDFSLLKLEQFLQNTGFEFGGKLPALEPEYLRASSAEEKLQSLAN